MSNIHSIDVFGTLPWDANCDEGMLTFIGQMHLPIFGIRMKFLDNFYVPNEHGGRTNVYNFHICGEEGIRHEWAVELLQAIERCGGTLKDVKFADIEAPQNFRWTGSHNLIPLRPRTVKRRAVR